ncbi:hypothetical protein D3C75_970210 [compost metagenome]
MLVFHFHGQFGGVEQLVLVPGHRQAISQGEVAAGIGIKTTTAIADLNLPVVPHVDVSLCQHFVLQID